MQTNLRRPQKLFGNPVRYEIPPFQRRYVWKEEEQWAPLWEDVEGLAQSIVDNSSVDAHFLGAIVLQPLTCPTGTIDRRSVVDGQQRLITLQLLIAAVQEVLDHQGQSRPAKRLLGLVENREEYRDGNPHDEFKVWPTMADQEAFKYVIRNDPSARDYSTFLIVKAHQYFKHQAQQWLERFPADTPRRDKAAEALDETIRLRLEIVVIDLGDSDNPHVIFETLNARGTRLLQSDMVKNRILHDASGPASDKATGDARRIWPFADDEWWNEEIGRGLQRRPRVDVYLNHWLTLRNRSETKPYDEFRAFERYANAHKANGGTIEEIAADLDRVGLLYRDVEDVRRRDITMFLRRRRVMNVGVAVPLLLWLLSAKLPSATLANCIKALESFLVRRVVCRYHARSYGDLFVGLIQRLDGNPYKDKTDHVVVSYLAEQTAQSTLWPNDNELREAFINRPMYQYLTRGRLRMVLEGIERELRPRRTESLEVPNGLPIEHIMPQSWSSHWPLPNDGANDDDAISRREEAIHTIGNLTLVTERMNASLSNSPWKKKRAALGAGSVLFLNKRLVDHGPEVWDEDAIAKRSESLYAVAVKIWPSGAGIETG